MKAIFFPAILIAAINCFSQSENVELTKQIAVQIERKK